MVEKEKLEPIEQRIVKLSLKIGRRIPGSEADVAVKLNSALLLLNQAQVVSDSAQAVRLISLANRILKVRG